MRDFNQASWDQGVPPQGESGSFRQRSSDTRKLFWRANIICGGLVLYYASGPVIFRIINLIAEHGFLPAMTPTVAAWWDFFFVALCFLIPIVFIARMVSLPTDFVFPVRKPRGILIVATVGCGLGASVLGTYFSAFVSSLVRNVSGLTPTMPDILPDVETDPAVKAIQIASIVIIPAIFEELLFRGVILQSLRRFGDRYALIVSALLFALSHQNLVQGPNALVNGLVMGYFVIRSGSLIPSMIFHFVNNGLASVLGVLMAGASEEFSIWANYLYLVFCLVMGLIGTSILLLLEKDALTDHRTLPAGQRWMAFFFAPFTILYLGVTAYLMMRYFA